MTHDDNLPIRAHHLDCDHGLDAGSAGDGERGGAIEDRLHTPDLCDLSADDHGHSIAERECFRAVVRDDNRRYVRLSQGSAKLAPKNFARWCVERRERFVEKENSGPPSHRSCERHTLLFSSRERSRKACRKLRDAKLIEQRRNIRIVRSAISDVFPHRHVGEQIVALREIADHAFLGRKIDAHVPIEPDRISELDSPLVRSVEPGDGAQYRRLARAGGAEQDRHPILAQLQLGRRPDRQRTDDPREVHQEFVGHARKTRLPCSAYIAASTKKDVKRRTTDVAAARLYSRA